jgi:putative endopeptidase
LTKEECKVAAFYSAAINEDDIEASGTSPLGPALAVCKRARDYENRAESIGVLNAQFGVSAFFGIYASPDKKNAAHSIC